MKNKDGSVKPGYKMTPLGEIPEDWKVKRLGDLGTFDKGSGIPKKELSKSGLPCVRYGEIYTTHEYVIKKFVSFIDNTVAVQSKRINKGDILLAGSGETVADIGKAVAFVDDFEAYAGGDIIIFTPQKKLLNSITIAYLLDSHFVKKQKARLGVGGQIVHIYPSAIKTISIPVMPLKEQKAIAKILSTWDKAIDKTRQLIEQKELRKKALMQQLLTGKKRLKGFSGEWKEVRLGDLGTTFTGLSGKTKSDFGVGKPYVPYLNVFNNFVIDIEHLDYVKVSPLEDQNRLKYGDIIFTTSSETPSEVGMASVVLDHVGELYLNSFCFGFRLHDFEILVPQYSSWYFRSSKFRMMINKFAQGATRYNLSKTQMMHLKVTLPSIKEQIAIANLLGITDADLKIEKERLEKLKLQKKALMQVLLTGKRRISCE